MITYAPRPAAVARSAPTIPLRANMTDRLDIIEKMAADIVRIRQRLGHVMRGHIIDEGWTGAQVDRFSGAAIARAKEIETEAETRS